MSQLDLKDTKQLCASNGRFSVIGIKCSTSVAHVFVIVLLKVVCQWGVVCVVSMEPPEKTRRLQELRGRIPYVSKSALSVILSIAKNEELPTDVCSRRSLSRTVGAVADITTPYGKLHKTIDADGLQLIVQNPPAIRIRWRYSSFYPYQTPFAPPLRPRPPSGANSQWQPSCSPPRIWTSPL